MAKERAADAQMRRHGAAEQAGQEYRAEQRRTRQRIEQGDDQCHHAEPTRQFRRVGIAELLHGLGYDRERSERDAAVEDQESDDEAAHDASGPELPGGCGG